ncbi:MAG TPA: PrgI family protein [Lachnospiraceae bacterium]|nr:PrgI family protein [Lachnospiraceae bacterium]
MVIEVNKDIDRYKESVVLGLTARQLIYSIISVLIGGGIVLLVYPYVGLTTSAYIAIPVVAPIALTGFYSYNGMTFMEMMKLKLHFSFGNKALTYVSTESADEIQKAQMAEEITGKKKGSFFGGKDNMVSGKKQKEESRQIQTGSNSSANKSLIVMLGAVLGLVGLFVAAAIILKMYM